MPTPVIKIKHGTPSSGKPLCNTCRHARMIRGQRLEEVVLCSGPFSGANGAGPVPFRIAECSDYHPVNMPWLHEMQDMAWKVEVKQRGPTGFSEGVTQPETEIVIRPPGQKKEPWE